MRYTDLPPIAGRFSDETFSLVTEFILRNDSYEYNSGEKEVMLQAVESGATLVFHPKNADAGTEAHMEVWWIYDFEPTGPLRFAIALWHGSDPDVAGNTVHLTSATYDTHIEVRGMSYFVENRPNSNHGDVDIIPVDLFDTFKQLTHDRVAGWYHFEFKYNYKG